LCAHPTRLVTFLRSDEHLSRREDSQRAARGEWERHKFESKLINPANPRKYEIIVVGSGLAGGSAAATIAAQGGINAAKNYQSDGDSVHRLFYDTIKGGDFRSREANVHRLAEVSSSLRQNLPSARHRRGRV